MAFVDRVRRWTAQVDWSTLENAHQALYASNAFVDASDAERRGLQLLQPGSDVAAIAIGDAP